MCRIPMLFPNTSLWCGAAALQLIPIKRAVCRKDSCLASVERDIAVCRGDRRYTAHSIEIVQDVICTPIFSAFSCAKARTASSDHVPSLRNCCRLHCIFHRSKFRLLYTCVRFGVIVADGFRSQESASTFEGDRNPGTR